MTTRVVHCKRENHDIYIGRPSKWGNPFEIGKDGTREDVVKKYKEWVVTQSDLMSSLHELKDKTIACWCSPSACHGDVLAELADKEENNVEMHVRVFPLYQNGQCSEEEKEKSKELTLQDYPIRICVAGSRSFHDTEKFDKIIRAYLLGIPKGAPYCFISGAAWRGADRLIIDWAKLNNVPCFEYPANWDEFGKRGGYIRNAEMRNDLTHLFALYDGSSRGTLEMIRETEKLALKLDNIHVSVLTVEPDQEWLARQHEKASQSPQFSEKRIKAKYVNGQQSSS